MTTHNVSASHFQTYLQSILPPALHPFFVLSYPISKSRLHISSSFPISRTRLPVETLYDKGFNDIFISISCAIGFTLLREVTLRYVASTFARAWLEASYQYRRESGKLTKAERRKMEHTVTRFAEQSWSFLYCTVFWLIGVVILSRIPHPFSPESLWGTYPIVHLPALTKFYYLAQLGWWFHQIYVINTEKRRSDHWQMFTHHILSIGLIISSYIAGFSRVGTVIHCLFDLCDIFLPLAKLFRYLSLTTLCDATFVLFLLAWLVSRQIGLALVIRSTYVDSPKFIPFKWDPPSNRYLTQNTYYGFLAMQTFLYCLATMWFYLACAVAVRVVRGQGAEDSRSDDEDDGDEKNGLEALDDVPEAHTTTTMNGGVRRRKMG